MTLIIQNLLNGLSIGAIYAIFALGYTLIFSILGIINFAHGAVFTIGAYLTYILVGGKFGSNGLLANFGDLFHLPFAIALFCGSFLTGCLGVLIELLAFRPLRRRGADALLTVVSSLGVAVFLVNLIQYLVGAESYAFPDNIYGRIPAAIDFSFGFAKNGIPIRTVQVIIFAIASVILALLTGLISYTKYGKAMRAVAEDPITASLLGINPNRYIILTFFTSSFIAGLAGALVSSSLGLAGPYFGMSYGLKGLAVIVLGGLGSIPGAVVGGLTIGIIEAFVPSDFSALKDAIAFAILFLMLLIRPQGLIGRKLVEKV
jgi:branched-chain amino acid transport system permease protein